MAELATDVHIFLSSTFLDLRELLISGGIGSYATRP
jgi:hypothetical protein